ncbi:hypothetical protein [Colwellia sp. PAMC 21821]|uniref:hypothetical protein n=1 Tax=Colwellia sp. PAMC 21821 TaxID=1816219 RepID=UPI0009BD9E93|nr:hypothetical protein [Colwellia sp. PAMC 21821]ARD44455.1 hypothetical protein A3Q33_09130 [Colwellia sp. PAMC 21821]
MDNQERIAIKNCINLLLDLKWHYIYEFHEKYRLLPGTIIKAVSFLESNGLGEVKGDRVKLSSKLSNEKIFILNQIQKTKKPDCLINHSLSV